MWSVLKNNVCFNFFSFFVVKNENFDRMFVLHRENQLRIYSFLHTMEEMAISHLVFRVDWSVGFCCVNVLSAPLEKLSSVKAGVALLTSAIAVFFLLGLI